MKQLLYLIRMLTLSIFVLCLTNKMHAQSGYLYADKVDSVFMHVDKSLITTNMLADRAYPLSRFDLYNPATDTVDHAFATQTYFELYQASYQRQNMLAPEILNNMVEWENLRARVPIMILDYLYNKTDTLALQDGLFYFQNDLLYDVPGRSRNPYFLQHLQMAAPLLEQTKATSLTFLLMPHFISRNTGLNIQQVSLDFGSGIQVMHGPLDSITINFSSPGIKNVTINVTLSNGSSFTSICQMTIGSSNAVSRIEGLFDPCRQEFVNSDYAFQGYDETQAFKGMLDVNYYYRTGAPCDGSNTTLNKPIIVIDGYDPTDKRNAAAIDSLFLFYYDDVNYNPKKYINVVQEMRDLGYDVIVVNISTYFHTYGGQIIPLPANANNPPAGYTYSMGKIIRGGGDYVERNGLTLVTLIERINQQLASQGSTEKLIVIGPSMGGQISRYALKWMEDRGKNHNVRLWVSFDSNHEGTMIPIGEQHFIKTLAGMSNDIQITLDRQLNSPHAKQSLVDHHLFHQNGVIDAGGAPGFHIRYFAMMDSLGWPQQLRKIAMVSGGDNGSELPIPKAGQLNLNINAALGRGGWFFGAICGFFSNSNCKLLDANLYTAPKPGVVGVVADLKFLILTRKWYGRGINLTRDQSIETIQSGYYWGYKELADKTTEGSLPKFLKKIMQVNLYSGYHAHQPTANTLAFGKGPNGTVYNFKWDDDVSYYNLVCDGYIPFDYYHGPKTFSVRHDSLFYPQARILIEEVNGIIHHNPQVHRYALISCNTNLICQGGTATFTLSPVIPGMVYTWTTSDPFLQIISGQGTPSIVVQHTGSASVSGSFAINCSASNDCFIVDIFAYNIWVGTLNPVWTYSTPQTNYGILQQSIGSSVIYNEACWYSWISTSTRPWTGRTVVWEPVRLGGAGITWYQSGDNLYLKFAAPGQVAKFVVHVTNACGTADYFYNFRGIQETGTSCPFYPDRMVIANETENGLKIYPNPSSEIVDVSLNDLPGANRQGIIFEIRIIDKMGNTRQQFRYKTGVRSAEINISPLPVDVYSVHVFDGQKWRVGRLTRQ